MTTRLARLGRQLYDRPYVLLSLTSLFWAGNIVLGRFVAGKVPPVGLAWTRWAGSFVLLIGFAWPHIRREWPIIRANLGRLSVMALTGVATYNTMAYWGLQYTEALNGLLIQSTGPLLIAVWSLVLFRDFVTPAQAVGVVVSMAGVATILTRGDPAALAGLRFNVGDVWMFAAMVIYAFYSALLRLKPALHWLSFLAFTVGLGAAMMTPAFLAELAFGRHMTLDLTTVLTLIYVVVFPSTLAYLFFIRGVELIGANRAGPFFHLMPVFGAALAILFLGERPQLFHAVGFALVLTGVFVAARKPKAAELGPAQ
ncbi:DMT family transporter [Chelatococcus sambhunathii]|uniref:DMT family transporter n=1 Tax=Chelatococcus sambhunathii TaxID=363953 RepID=A0ABU1DDX4_9HYPH|nr:DMT family transporter [Chelatococcus sambhunathii]MDR4306261.1 DMT family transporter [Chelatococcus sambhunathii]